MRAWTGRIPTVLAVAVLTVQLPYALPATAHEDAQSTAKHPVANCRLPAGEIRQLGRRLVYIAAGRTIRNTGAECRGRSGEQVERYTTPIRPN